MGSTPRQDEENLEADIAKIRVAARMRLGVVAGVVIVGLVQTHFPSTPDADLLTQMHGILAAAMPVLFLTAAGVLVVLGLAFRNIKRVRAAYESKRFRVPRRRS